MAPAMISPIWKALCALLIALGSTSIALAQSTFYEVRSTPYDHQMERVNRTLNAPSAYAACAPSIDVVNGWMTSLRDMPYQYSPQWRTPYEVETDRAGDCKGKALLLYDLMQSKGATNVRLVIGKRLAEDTRTHAWLEWQTRIGTLLLDPTFNWNAAVKLSNPRTYVAFYGYRAGHKYRATNLLLANRTLAARRPAAPAHGTITRTAASTYSAYSSYSNSWPVYDRRPIQNLSQTGSLTSGSRSPQSQMHNFRRRIDAQRKPISNPVRNDKLARPAFVQSGPIAKQGWAESSLLVQH